jgi:hypothetical protein
MVMRNLCQGPGSFHDGRSCNRMIKELSPTVSNARLVRMSQGQCASEKTRSFRPASFLMASKTTPQCHIRCSLSASFAKLKIVKYRSLQIGKRQRCDWLMIRVERRPGCINVCISRHRAPVPIYIPGLLIASVQNMYSVPRCTRLICCRHWINRLAREAMHSHNPSAGTSASFIGSNNICSAYGVFGRQRRLSLRGCSQQVVPVHLKLALISWLLTIFETTGNSSSYHFRVE